MGWDCDPEAVELETGEQGNGMMGEVCRESLEASWSLNITTRAALVLFGRNRSRVWHAV